MNCSSCGASISPEETECPSCGGPVPDAEAPGTGAAGEQPVPSESLEELLQRKPSALGAGVRLLLMLLFGLVFAGLAVIALVGVTVEVLMGLAERVTVEAWGVTAARR